MQVIDQQRNEATKQQQWHKGKASIASIHPSQPMMIFNFRRKKGTEFISLTQVKFCPAHLRGVKSIAIHAFIIRYYTANDSVQK